MISRTMLVLIIGLIVVSTVLFVTGVVIERGVSSNAAAVSTTQGQTSSTSQDPDGGHESTSTPQDSHKVQNNAGSHSESVFGLDLENPWFIAAFVLIWLLLIVALNRFGRIALPLVLLIAVIAMVLDVGEVMRKVGEANTVLATFAALVAVAHVVIAVLALLILVRGERQGTVIQM